MDMILGDLIKFNESLDSKIDTEKLDEEFITSKQVVLEGISKNSDVRHLPFIALSYAKLMELTVLLTGTYADNCQTVEFGNLVANPRHIDVCILNARLIREDYGITDSMPLWFKKQVHERIDSQYSEDLGRMVVDPSLLFHFIEKGLLLGIVKKERHSRLSDQFRDCISDAAQFAFSNYIEESHTPAQVIDCGCGWSVNLDVASWLAGNTVLNIVKGPLKTDLINVLSEVMAADYLKAINKKFEKAHNSLSYVNMGRKNFANYPYEEEVPIAEWDDINNTLCHFKLDGYGMIQSELDKALSNPCYKSPFLNELLYPYQETIHDSKTITKYNPYKIGFTHKPVVPRLKDVVNEPTFFTN
ncbi:hypothetical protein [Maridesulfovibrio sp. FT414]|uniref:hypothetical protein n=1 Tax=Maridesulfovibrio sp. FT414 TaxID=2979469 RepID=UPI003D800CAF